MIDYMMFLIPLLLLFHSLAAAPFYDDEEKPVLVFPTGRPPSDPTDPTAWKKTVRVREPDQNNNDIASDDSYGILDSIKDFPSLFLDQFSRTYEEDDIIKLDFNVTELDAIRAQYNETEFEELLKNGRPEGLTENALEGIVNDEVIGKKLSESANRMIAQSSKEPSQVNEQRNSEHRFAVATHYICPSTFMAYSMNFVLRMQEERHIIPGQEYYTTEQCRYGVTIDQFELIRDEQGKPAKQIYIDPEFHAALGEKLKIHVFRPDFEKKGKEWPKSDVQTEYEWLDHIRWYKNDITQTSKVKSTIRALTSLRGAHHLNIGCKDLVDSKDEEVKSLGQYLCQHKDHLNLVKKDYNATKAGQNSDFVINLHRILMSIMPMNERYQYMRICGDMMTVGNRVIEQRSLMALSEKLDSVYSVDSSYTKTFDRTMELDVSKQYKNGKKLLPYRIGRGDVLLKRIRKAEFDPHYYPVLDDATVAARKKKDCERDRARERKSPTDNLSDHVLKWVFNFINSFFEDEC